MQRVIAWLQQTLQHDRDHVAGFERILSTVESTLSLVIGGGDTECTDLTDAMLRPRLEAVRIMSQRVTEALDVVEHLVVSGLCSYCFPEEDNASFSITSQDGPAARQLAALSVQMEVAQEDLRKSDVQVFALDSYRRCVPAYLTTLLAGTAVGEYASASSQTRRTAEGEQFDSASLEAMSYGVEAVARLRLWPLERRRRHAGFAREALDFLDKDFYEIAERLLASIVGPPSRLVHQAQVLALALNGEYHRSSNHPTARLFWGLAEEPKPPVLRLAPDSEAPAQVPAAVQATPEGTEADPGAAFGLVVLISNRTEAQTVEELVDRLEGPRALFLEDTCGDALEALGSGCHSGGSQQARCLRPVHAARIQELVAERAADRRPLAAWRRHAATRSVAHSAWSLATAHWGAGCTAWVADLRPARFCPGALPLAAAVSTVPGARLRVVQKPEELLGLSVAAADLEEAGGNALAAPGMPAARRPSSAQAAESGPHRAWAPDTPLATRLAEYIEFHRRSVEVLAVGREGADMPSVLVYSCQPFSQCGGHGDRLNGIVTVFLLAVLTGRVFLLDSESPMPLQMFLAPRLIDWRVRGSILATAGLRHHSYHDKRRQFEADVGVLKAYEDPVLVLSMNYRMIRTLFEAPELRQEAAALGLPEHSPPFLAAEVFDVLFAPSPALRHEVRQLRTAMGGLEDGRFIALHLRTGAVAWDPVRHGASELATFLECAGRAEAELGLPPDTPWLLATDSSEAAEAAIGMSEALSGKLRVPGARGRVHIERSDIGDVIDGATANYAEWLLFGRAAAAVLSRSFFGETAAEVGRVQHAYFAPGGACVRMELSSS